MGLPLPLLSIFCGSMRSGNIQERHLLKSEKMATILMHYWLK